MHPRLSGMIFIWLTVAVTAAFAQQDPQALYDAALERFRADDFSEAVRLFEQFRAAAPQDAKADDALWYIGRALVHLGRPEEAAARFEEVRAIGPQGNRYIEATTDLARLRLEAGDPAAAATLLEPLKKERDLDSADRQALHVLADALVRLGREHLEAHREEQARSRFAEAVAEYELLLRKPSSNRDQLRLLEDLGRAYARLMEAAPDAKAYAVYREGALQALDQALGMNPEEPKRSRLQKLRDEIAAPTRPKLQGRIEGRGGAAYAAIERPSVSGLWAPGAQVSAQLDYPMPLGWQRQLTLSAGFTHDDFSLRTFNFAGTEMDAGRILQRTDDFDAALSWETGSSRRLRSELKLSGGYRLAEDPEFRTYGLKAREKLHWLAGPSWKLELDGSFAYSAYPDYVTSAGRELDNWLAGLKPEVTWHVSPDFSLGLGYGFRLKQYLNATYLTELNKQYLTHSAQLTLRATPGRVFHPTLGYAFSYNQSRNYDVDLTGIGGTIVHGYYDYLENGLDLGLPFKWSPDFRTELNAKAALQNFLNYPAQNAGGTALSGEKRRDLNLRLDAELSYRLWKKERIGFGDLSALLRLAYEQNFSNTFQEASFQTNYVVVSVTGGLSLEFK